MRKTNRGLFTLIIGTFGFFPLNHCFSQNFGIVIPNSYFGEGINTQNRSDVYFQTQGNDGFGLVFLGNPIEQTTVLNIGNSSITCSKQLKGYYTTNYGNFHLLPLDSDSTTPNSSNISISDQKQGLFYDCYNGSTQYTGVYGYIKWTVGNFGNTQEIRAGVNENGNGFLQTSPLKLVYSSAGNSRALSGFARDSLGKQSRFVVNMGLSQPECTPSTCFNNSIQVSCDSDFRIYYTINGDEPTCNDTRRENTNFSDSTTLKVIACTGSLSSSTKTYTYQKDNKPPMIPTIDTEPEFTQGLTNTIDIITPATDQGCNLNTNTIQYQFCKSTTNNINNCNQPSNLSARSGATSTTFNDLTHGHTYYYFVRSKDIAGNTSNWSQSTYSTQDNKGPEITFNPQSGNAALSHTVTIIASDDISKLKNDQNIKFKRQTNDTCNETDDYVQTQLNIPARGSESGSISVSTPSSNGEYYLCVLGGTISDIVGNTNDTTRSPGKFIVQDTPTTVSATNSSEQWKSGDIQITLNASSPTSSYTAQYTRTSMTDCNNGTTFTDGDEIQKNNEGTGILYLCIANSQGQRGTRSGVYKLDKTPPTGHFINFPSNCLARDTTTQIQITGSDTISGLPDTYVSWNGGGWSDSNTYVARAGQSITGIIRDNAGNMTTLTGTVEVCPDSNNFELIYDSSCTSGSVTITVSGDQRHVKEYKRTTYNNSNQSTTTSSSNRKQFDQNTNGRVEIILNNGTTISGDNLHFNITNIDREAPQVSIYTPDNIYECELGTIKFKVKDLGCGSGGIYLKINEKESHITGSGEGEIEFEIYSGDKGDYPISYEITDSVGNKIQGATGLTIQDFRITGRDFRRELIESGDYLFVSGYLDELSNAQAGSCEPITREFISCNVDFNTNYVVLGRPNYTPNPRLKFLFQLAFPKENLPENKTIQCNFKLSDGDTDINVTGTFKLCTGDINCNPTLHPIFKSGDKFVYYAEKNENYYKYSSGYENITIDIDGDGFSDIARYRYSCIKEEDYCQNIRPRNPCDGEIQGSEDAESYGETICQDLTLFYETNNITDPYACDTTISSRSDRTPYGDGLFTMDISGENCPRSDTIPYQSKNQGPRQIRVQVEDEKGRISEKIPTDILNYTTENPTLDLASNNKMNYSRWGNQNMKPAAINSDSFTIVLSASGASLNNGLVGYNDIFVHSLNNNFSILKDYNVLNFDIVDGNQNIYRWLKSVYSGGTN